MTMLFISPESQPREKALLFAPLTAEGSTEEGVLAAPTPHPSHTAGLVLAAHLTRSEQRLHLRLPLQIQGRRFFSNENDYNLIFLLSPCLGPG